MESANNIEVLTAALMLVSFLASAASSLFFKGTEASDKTNYIYSMLAGVISASICWGLTESFFKDDILSPNEIMAISAYIILLPVVISDFRTLEIPIRTISLATVFLALISWMVGYRPERNILDSLATFAIAYTSVFVLLIGLPALLRSMQCKSHKLILWHVGLFFLYIPFILLESFGIQSEAAKKFDMAGEKIGIDHVRYLIGWGDLWFFPIMGIIGGTDGLLTVFFVSIPLASIYGILEKIRTGNSEMPLGPFLVAGIVAAFLDPKLYLLII